jgi:hypothetical protein
MNTLKPYLAFCHLALTVVPYLLLWNFTVMGDAAKEFVALVVLCDVLVEWLYVSKFMVLLFIFLNV